jgi:hypothetical protein
MIVREGDRLREARLGWREGPRGHMVPTVYDGTREVAPDRVEILAANEDQREALALAGWRVVGK